MPKESTWLLAGASARGPGHDKRNLPNQDSFVIRKNRNEQIVALVVSDGAGSATQSEKGSQTCASIMAATLLDIGEKHSDHLTGVFQGKQKSRHFIQDAVAAGLAKVRQVLDPSEKSLADFHHTFTGALLTPAGGFLAQIGDSPAISAKATLLKTPETSEYVDFFAESQIYLVEKGEYVNETCFVTQLTWLQNLRLTHVPAHSALLIMSDGAGDLVINRGEIFRPFISNVLSNVLKKQNREQRDEVIREAIAAPEADSITSDDKTLIIACPKDWLRFADLEYVSGDTIAPKQPAPASKLQPEPLKPASSPGKSKSIITSGSHSSAVQQASAPYKNQKKTSLWVLIILCVFVLGVCLGAWSGEQLDEIVKSSQSWLEKCKKPTPPEIPKIPPPQHQSPPVTKKSPVAPEPSRKKQPAYDSVTSPAPSIAGEGQRPPADNKIEKDKSDSPAEDFRTKEI